MITHTVALQILIADERQLAGSGPVDDRMLIHAICCRFLQQAADCSADQLTNFCRMLSLRTPGYDVEHEAIGRSIELICQVLDDLEDAGSPVPMADREGEIS